MPKRNRSLIHNDEHGHAFVELALLLPVILTLLMAVADLGRGVSQYVEVGNAAAAAAEYAAQGPSEAANTTQIKTVACDDLGGLSCSNISVTNSANDGTGEGMSMVQVTVSVPFTSITPFVGGIHSFNLTSSTTMRVNPDGT